MEQTDADNKRYPCPLWIRVPRWIFLHWGLLPLVCLIVAIIFYLVDVLWYNQPFAFFTRYWWQIILFLVVGAGLLFLTYTRAEADKTRENHVLRQREQRQREQQQRELELQPPPAGFTLQYTLSGHTDVVWSVTWSPVVACSPLPLLTRPFASGMPRLLNLSIPSPVIPARSIAWPGRLLASASNDTTIRLWDAQTTQHLHTLSGHTGTVYSVAWSPDGRQLASASSDTTIRLWDSQTTQHLHTLFGHSDVIYSVLGAGVAHRTGEAGERSSACEEVFGSGTL